MSSFFINLEIDTEERYDMGKFMSWEVDNYDPLTSVMFRELVNIEQAGRTLVQTEEERPDRTSYMILGHYQYWWILLFYNEFIDVQSFTSEKMIAYPNLDLVEELFFSLKSMEFSRT